MLRCDDLSFKIFSREKEHNIIYLKMYSRYSSCARLNLWKLQTREKYIFHPKYNNESITRCIFCCDNILKYMIISSYKSFGCWRWYTLIYLIYFVFNKSDIQKFKLYRKRDSELWEPEASDRNSPICVRIV